MSKENSSKMNKHVKEKSRQEKKVTVLVGMVFFSCHFVHNRQRYYGNQKPTQNKGYLRARLHTATLAFPSWLCVNVFYLLLIHQGLGLHLQCILMMHYSKTG